MRKTPDGLLLREIGDRVGIAHRTLRDWLKRGLLPHAPFRGAGTRYGADVLERAARIARLRREKRNLEDIRRVLAEEDAVKARTPPVARAEAVAAGEGAAGGDVGGFEAWRRIVLVPGLELHVREGGGPLLSRLAAEIRANYRVDGAPGAASRTEGAGVEGIDSAARRR